MKLFPKFNKNRAADMIKKDLKEAGIPYEDAAGRFADFHSLRYTFITTLTKKGIHPKIVQALARHSSIKLTMDRYSRPELLNERSALEVLPTILPDLVKGKEASRAVAQRTGTDDLPVAKVGKTAAKTVTKTATNSLLGRTNYVRESQ